MSFVYIHDLPSDTDPTKTIKEANLERQHAIPVGKMVEVEGSGVRLFVVEHARDCDGTPLYCLCWEMMVIYREPGFFPGNWATGYPEESLTVVQGMDWAGDD